MAQQSIKEIAVFIVTTIFIFTLILLTIQSITGHKSWFLSVVISFVIMLVLFTFITKQVEKSEKFVHKNNYSR